MLIRRAEAADLPAIRAIASQSPEAAQWSEQHYALATADPGRLLLVAEDAGGPAGFLAAREIAGEWELENVAVAAAFRRRGIARALIREFTKTAVQRGSGAIHLEVRSRNAAARALYEASGFSQNGCRRGYYHCPEDDAILYTRQLPPAAPERD